MRREYPMIGVQVTASGPLVLTVHVSEYLEGIGLEAHAAHRNEVLGAVLDALENLSWDVSVTIPEDHPNLEVESTW